jgi:hypothetical protein
MERKFTDRTNQSEKNAQSDRSHAQLDVGINIREMER